VSNVRRQGRRDANVEQVRLQVTEDVWNGYYAVDSANKQLEATASLIKTMSNYFAAIQ